jgi:uncharacterized RDD family membrane protein YckC
MVDAIFFLVVLIGNGFWIALDSRNRDLHLVLVGVAVGFSMSSGCARAVRVGDGVPVKKRT